MYQEWARDFRCCERDCESAILHLKNRTLVRWYERKTESIKSDARLMLAGVSIPDAMHQLPDNETNMTMPTNLVTMKRRNESTNDYKIVLMTRRIAEVVADVQQERGWYFNGEILRLYLRNPETRAAAGNVFEKMFLKKFQKDPSKMPPCFKMDNTNGIHPKSPLRNNAKAAMPWEGLGQPTVENISTGKDADGSYCEKELGAVIDAAIDKDSPPFRLLIPVAKNWPSWDAAVVLYTEEEGKRAVHVIFLQTTIDPDHKIYAKGLNLVRDAIPVNWKLGDGLDIYYHYVLVLLVDDSATLQIPPWRHVLLSSKEKRKDPSWSPDNLSQYAMFIHKDELFKPS
jgi:hypothetical protein